MALQSEYLTPSGVGFVLDVCDRPSAKRMLMTDLTKKRRIAPNSFPLQSNMQELPSLSVLVTASLNQDFSFVISTG